MLILLQKEEISSDLTQRIIFLKLKIYILSINYYELYHKDDL